ncbi:MAG: thiD [Anaerospora sp.]|nr:thiD [Anaerospora sp.]
MKNLLTIAGSDSSGGAGIQADLKTFSAHGTYGMSVITAVTAQNTQGVLAVQDISADIIAQQLEAVFEDIEVHAVKIGMVSVEETINTIAAKLRQYQAKNIVVDPVMVSKSGFRLLQPEAQARLVSELLPLATIITPNIPEAEVITGKKIETFDDMQQAAQSIYALGAKNVLIKGGHRQTDATDILFDGEDFYYLPSARIPSTNTHGLGKGVGPVHHFYALYKKAGLI